MSKTTDPEGQELMEARAENNTTLGGEDVHDTRVRRIIERVLWFIGLCVLLSSAYFIHLHKGPLPGEVDFSRAVQSIHYWPWLLSVLTFFSTFNDIQPSIIEVSVVFVFFLLIRWWKDAFFFLLSIGLGNGLNILIGDYVVRPRPSPKLIHVYTPLMFNSFPSGHTEHDVVFYGALLYITFTKDVREWRYHWILIPFQIFAFAAILGIGYSRVLEGEHWLSDVLGGYLSGLLWLFLMIFVYRWVTNLQHKHQLKKEGMRQEASSVSI
ncbi:phosphatase PAP2 family protein [Dictyobacter alpinus]|uniref:Phosphatase PAP2 family protein n=1 Tax=Dictyobacter alpinus TaxID=2014873 RepID=A0A402BIQ3_9CHLR|nr:phosphatase PAP2 family protein [Dictyobacter alpinus]GCE31112.1 phosphatase PAP2 family protein [Dictyobacter alpinus]